MYAFDVLTYIPLERVTARVALFVFTGVLVLSDTIAACPASDLRMLIRQTQKYLLLRYLAIEQCMR